MIRNALAWAAVLLGLLAATAGRADPGRAEGGDGGGGGGFRLTPDELANRPTLCVVPEMVFIPEVDTWQWCPADAFPEQAEAFKAEWIKRAPWAAGHVTPELVRAISRWAKPQMEKYEAVPALDKLAFHPVARHGEGQYVVYEAKVDDLPSHSTLVNRWLKLYALYDPQSKAVLRLTVTIRGQALE